MSENPLLNYRIQPGTFVRLPSGGKFYDHPPQLTVDGEIEVKPMNAVDELHFMNPDSLLNNEALFQVIRNCVPGIPEVREILKPDMDVIILGLRIATYGENLEVTGRCRKCKKEDTYMANLTNILATTKMISDDTAITLNDLTVNIKPFSVASQQQLTENMVQLRRTTNDLARRLKGNETDDQIIEKLKSEMNEMVEANARGLFAVAAASIVSVEMPNGVVITEPAYIHEWLDSLRAPDYKVIRDAVKRLSEEAVSRKMNFTCTHCEHKNEMEVEFDPANFFDTNSAKP
jgi:hypothetical protein